MATGQQMMDAIQGKLDPVFVTDRETLERRAAALRYFGDVAVEMGKFTLAKSQYDRAAYLLTLIRD